MVRLLFLLLLGISVFAETVTIQVLATTDMHGNILPWDYYTSRTVPRGLAKVATLIKQARAANPNTLLIDNGDTIQGTPLEALHQSRVREGKADRSDPMMLVMNKLGYAAMTVGNHEFNFGLKNLNRARDEAQFPWLSGNTLSQGGARPFDAYVIKTIKGVRVAIFGITTPNIPNWEKPENYAGYTFQNGVEAAKVIVERLKAEKVDLIIGSVHAGLAPKSGRAFENMADAIAKQVPGIDAIVYGHTHQTVEELQVNDTLMSQPGRWADHLSAFTFDLDNRTGSWKVTGKKVKLLRVTTSTPVDPEIEALVKPYHDAAEKWLSTPIAKSTVDLDSQWGRIEDTALVDAIQKVQMHYAKADVSFAALFNQRLKVKKGNVTVREIAALYLYENELYAIEGNGAMVKAALENAARYYLACKEPTCSTGPLTNKNRPGYNFDIAQGVDYEIDLSKPDGQRIQNLRYRGKPLKDDQKLRIAINNYRAGGSNGYTMFKDAPILWKSNREIRDLIIEYYSEHKTLPAKPDNNWKILPLTARPVLQQEASGNF